MNNVYLLRRLMFNLLAAFGVIVLLAGADAYAARKKPTNNSSDNSCKVIGLVPLGTYITKKERKCFSKASKATSAGYLALNTAGLNSGLSGGTKNQSCKLVGVKEANFFVRAKDTKCFKSAAKAEKKGYTKFVLSQGNAPTPTPTATPTATPTGTTPTGPGPDPVDTDPANAVNYPSFTLGETTPGSGYSATCDATLAGDRNSLRIHCVHNVPSLFEAHVHPAPENIKFCVLANPASPEFEYTCPLTPEQAQSVFDGNGLLALHIALGAENQAAAGFIRN